MKLTLGFSPCPNDIFIFDALINKKIDTKNLDFEIFIEDVENLNKKAFQSELDITKISYHAFAHLTKRYILLNSGGALGRGCGPLLICKDDSLNLENLANLKIAIPGKYTTANFLMNISFPKAQKKTEMLFSDIEDAVISEKVDAGLIIHENRFTYQEKGLKKLLDLGEYWEKSTKKLIPLGGIIAKKSLPKQIITDINDIIRSSIEYALNNPNSSRDFIKKYAQEMDDVVIKRHIDLYVNQYSVDLGDEGRNAVKQMFDLAEEKKMIPQVEAPIFI